MSKHNTYMQSILDRRDFRQSKGEPEIPAHRKKGAGKKICKKSKTGDPHSFTLRVEKGLVRTDLWGHYECDRCGKHGKHWFNWT